VLPLPGSPRRPFFPVFCSSRPCFRWFRSASRLSLAGRKENKRPVALFPGRPPAPMRFRRPPPAKNGKRPFSLFRSGRRPALFFLVAARFAGLSAVAFFFLSVRLASVFSCHWHETYGQPSGIALRPKKKKEALPPQALFFIDHLTF
jgi:hypothetical protein